MKKMITLAVALCAAALQMNAGDYLASSFGIKSDGKVLNTRSIQKAIDTISEEGGGKLIFKVGRYLTGTICLKDNVTIELGEGAILVGSPNPYDYDKVLGSYGLVVAYGAKNIALTGLGVVDGNGSVVANNYLSQIAAGHIKDKLGLGRPAERPHAIYFRECKNVAVKGITVKDSAFWTQTYDRCENLTIDGISVSSRAFWNNDGMDIVDCNGVLIQNCFVDASDDGICLKSHSASEICQNVTVRNNVVTSSASAIKFGTFGLGGFKNVKIINNTVYDTFRSAVAIESVDGGICENILVDSLKSYNTANPIFLIVGQRRGAKKSSMNGITISNLYAEVPAGKPDAGMSFEGPTLEDEPRNISPCPIVGLAGQEIRDVVIENVEIHFPGAGDPSYAKVGLNELDLVPEMPEAYPEFSQHKELPAWGFYVRHVRGISFTNVRLFAAEKDYRPAIVLDDVQGEKLVSVKASAPSLRKTVYKRK